MPAQGSVVIQEGLRVKRTNIRKEYKIYIATPHEQVGAELGTVCYLEDDVAVSLIELSMERFIHLEWNKILYLPNGHTRNLKEGGMKHN